MKNYKLALASALVSILLAGCGGAKDIKLSESNEPENVKKLQEKLTPAEMSSLKKYVVTHHMRGDLNYNLTVKEALAAQEEDDKLKKRAADAANQIQ